MRLLPTAPLQAFPDVFSRFMMNYGLVTILDPLLILLMDVITMNWEHGDLFKLYNWFLATEGSAFGPTHYTELQRLSLPITNTTTY